MNSTLKHQNSQARQPSERPRRLRSQYPRPQKTTWHLTGFLLLVGAITACSMTEETPRDRQLKSADAGSELRTLKDEEVRQVLRTVGHQAPVPGMTSADLQKTGEIAYGKEQRSVVQFVAPAAMKTRAPILDYVGPIETRENYGQFIENGVKLVQEAPVSTFSVDVDTASYANVRRWLNGGHLPPTDAVRTEELVNYFSYDYEVPDTREQPFLITTEIAPNPWRDDRHLLMVGLKGYEQPPEMLPPANLVFLIDTSGSMQSRDKLDMVKGSLKMLSAQLGKEDRISIVVYAGSAGVVLNPTAGDATASLNQALDQLTAGGSTNGSAGIQLAYQLAKGAYIDNGINRVILATDGDFNVGVTNQQALKELVEEKRKAGISLTVLGFGQGNYNDSLMQELAQIGDGNAAYIDTMREARKVLVDEMSSTLDIIARDVKIQVEFNPETVSEYRLVGYETRHLKREDFNNDKVDAGDIGAGHTVTALYELTLKGAQNPAIDALRYGSQEERAQVVTANELAHVKLRYKHPAGGASKLTSAVVTRQQTRRTLADASANFRFSAAVAAFAQQLKGGRYITDFDYTDTVELARNARGRDENGYRSEFVSLVKTVAALAGNAVGSTEVSQR